jgi:hypothetical protein
MAPKGVLKICAKGHHYYKSSDCPTCPVCEQERKPAAGFLSNLAAPARRALEGANILTLNALSRYSKDELLALHGMGPNALKKLMATLKANGLSLQKKSRK